MRKDEHEGQNEIKNREEQEKCEEKRGYFKTLKNVLKAMANFLGASSEPDEAERKLKDIYKWLS